MDRTASPWKEAMTAARKGESKTAGHGRIIHFGKRLAGCPFFHAFLWGKHGNPGFPDSPCDCRVFQKQRGGCRPPVPCVGRPAEVAVNQIRTVSKARLGPRIGSLSDDEASTLRRLITEMFGE